ncbi:MAG: DNA cytosine methyltransferase [Ignavibacteriales bacterium]
MTYIDLFAGAGGLSEGFINERFHPIAHVEMNEESCNTLKSRVAFHYLSKNHNLKIYNAYLKKEISRDDLWASIPAQLINSVICKEISEVTIEGIFKKIESQNSYKNVDVLVGGPPCQAYSIAGRSRDPNGMKGDKRNFLFRYYAKFLNQYKPKYFLFENVMGLLTAGNAKYFNAMCKMFTEIGYSVDYKVLNAADYGVLQKRKRVFIIGRKGNLKFKFPELDITENNWQTKRDLFVDLPHLQPGQEMDIVKYTKPVNEYLMLTGARRNIDFTTQHITRNHNERDLKIYSLVIDKWLNQKHRLRYDEIPKSLQTHSNTKSFLDRYKVIDPNGLSHTIVAHIAKDGHYYIYPDPRQIRSISVREAARLQSFADDYYFEGGRTSAFRQIGNAVPPLMAQKIAKSIKHLLDND